MNIQTKHTNKDVEILIVEDSPTQAEELIYTLEKKGLQVRLASDGQQALTLLLDNLKPALIISDILMPQMDGYELCRRIKANENTRQIPVVLLTQLGNPDDVLEGLACGADGFITKPYSEDYLQKHVDHILAFQLERKMKDTLEGMEIEYAGQRRLIKASPQQIVGLLLSTYEAVAYRNIELIQAQAGLKSANELLENQTAALLDEIAERERLQDELRALSIQDTLTGLLNRRGFITLAEQHWHLAQRTGQEFALLYLDLDRLKHINDTFGHTQGDQALQTVALALKKSFRESDILGRIGGDEFCVVFTDCDPASTQDTIKRLKDNLDQSNAGAAHLYTLSLSAGLAYFNASNQVSISDLMKHADAEMYAQKKRASHGEGT